MTTPTERITDAGTFLVDHREFTGPDDNAILVRLRMYHGKDAPKYLPMAKIVIQTIGWLMVEMHGRIHRQDMEDAANCTINSMFEHLGEL